MRIENEYEFKELIAQLLKKNDFIFEETPLLRDAGVDFIAFSRKPFYSGKYLVQCKCLKSIIDKPAVQDFYKVVLSNNANKGIIITYSYFTDDAKTFAESKNIEIINGNMLNELLTKFSRPKDSINHKNNSILIY